MNTSLLKELRIEKGNTQIEIANLLGLKTASAYSKKENGKIPISLKEAKLLADYFNKPLDLFVSKLS